MEQTYVPDQRVISSPQMSPPVPQVHFIEETVEAQVLMPGGDQKMIASKKIKEKVVNRKYEEMKERERYAVAPPQGNYYHSVHMSGQRQWQHQQQEAEQFEDLSRLPLEFGKLYSEEKENKIRLRQIIEGEKVKLRRDLEMAEKSIIGLFEDLGVACERRLDDKFLEFEKLYEDFRKLVKERTAFEKLEEIDKVNRSPLEVIQKIQKHDDQRLTQLRQLENQFKQKVEEMNASLYNEYIRSLTDISSEIRALQLGNFYDSYFFTNCLKEIELLIDDHFRESHLLEVVVKSTDKQPNTVNEYKSSPRGAANRRDYYQQPKLQNSSPYKPQQSLHQNVSPQAQPRSPYPAPQSQVYSPAQSKRYPESQAMPQQNAQDKAAQQLQAYFSQIHGSRERPVASPGAYGAQDQGINYDMNSMVPPQYQPTTANLSSNYISPPKEKSDRLTLYRQRQ